MDDIGALRRDEMREAAHVQGHGERVFGTRGKRHKDAPLGLQLPRHPAAGASNERPRPRRAKRGRDLDRRVGRGAVVKTGQELQHGGAGQRMSSLVSEWQMKSVRHRTTAFNERKIEE